METLQEAFESFRVEALRLEALPRYQVQEEAEALQALREGQKPDMSFLSEWLRQVEDRRRRGLLHRRLRLIGNPPGEYERFELTYGYPLTQLAGEEIRVLESTPSKVPQDCWIFDRSIVFHMAYDSNGQFQGAHRVGPERSAELVRQVEHLWRQGQPLATADV